VRCAGFSRDGRILVTGKQLCVFVM
jgi:hypothetical protein